MVCVMSELFMKETVGVFFKPCFTFKIKLSKITCNGRLLMNISTSAVSENRIYQLSILFFFFNLSSFDLIVRKIKEGKNNATHLVTTKKKQLANVF